MVRRTLKRLGMLILFIGVQTIISCSSSGSDDNNTESSSSVAEPSSSSYEEPSSSSVAEPSSNSSEMCNNTSTHFCDERDGQSYRFTVIGKQTWMAENLRYNAKGTMGRCFRDEPENCNTLGVMYTFQEMFCEREDGCLNQWGVVEPVELGKEMGCPAGWHVPYTIELEELFTFADPNFIPGSEASGQGRNSAAKKLKAVSAGGTDEFGFNALPGGFCGGGCPAEGNRWTTLYPATTADPIRSTFWWHKGFGDPVPLTKSWQMITTSDVVDDAYQSYGTSRFYTRCLKNSEPTPKSPEQSPQNTACVGTGTAEQKCHYGMWKNYFTDERDGQEYPYVEINGKKWIAANLNYKTSDNKCRSVEVGYSDAKFESCNISLCYNGLDENCAIFGKLYNFDGALDACPQGWHLPTDKEWTDLLAAVGGTGSNSLVGAASNLKTRSGWVQNGTDAFGFAALPGSYGISLTGNISAILSEVGFGTARGGFWWSATLIAANGAWIRHIGPTLENVSRVDNDIQRLYSVRCVAD